MIAIDTNAHLYRHWNSKRFCSFNCCLAGNDLAYAELKRGSELIDVEGNLALFVALFAVFLVWFLLYRTSWGLKLRLVGHNPRFAEYSGIKSSTIMVSAMTASGMLGGLLGSIFVQGQTYGMITVQFEGGLAFEGILVAIVARARPLAVPFVAARADYGTDQTAYAAQGRYDLIEQQVEALQAKGPLRTRDQHALCFAYAKLKRHDRLMPCLDQLEAGVRRGDRRTRLFGLDDATPTVHLMRAEALIDLGDLNAARAQANEALIWLRKEQSDDHDMVVNAYALLTVAAAIEWMAVEWANAGGPALRGLPCDDGQGPAQGRPTLAGHRRAQSGGGRGVQLFPGDEEIRRGVE